MSYKLLIAIYVELFFAKAKLIWAENFVIYKKVINLVINNLSRSFEIGRYLVTSHSSPDLKTGLILAIFNFDGTIPVDKEQLKI